MIVPATYNIEMQAFTSDVFNLLLFAGPQLSLSLIDVNGAALHGYSDSYLFGFQGGMQIAFNVSDVIGIQIVAMTMSSSGRQKQSFRPPPREHQAVTE